LEPAQRLRRVALSQSRKMTDTIRWQSCHRALGYPKLTEPFELDHLVTHHVGNRCRGFLAQPNQRRGSKSRIEIK